MKQQAKNIDGCKVYMTVQPLLLSLLFFTCRATRAASVKASFTPRFFMAEHSSNQSVNALSTTPKMYQSYRGIAAP
jgi:hypothetical protein